MKRVFVLIPFLLFFFPFFLAGAPEDYAESTARAKTGKASYSELLSEQKKCYSEYIAFFRKKYEKCAKAQEKRNIYLNNFAKEDKRLAPAILKFNRGMVRNALDKKSFSDVYKKFSDNKDFMQLDKALWEEKTKAAFSSIKSRLSDDKKDWEKSYHDIMQTLTEALEKSIVEKMTANYTASKEKGSALYQKIQSELALYKKVADPKEMAKAKRNISLLCKELFRQSLEHAPELKALMKKIEKRNLERMKRELELELANKEAAYARYVENFGLKIASGGKNMKEIILQDPAYKKIVNELTRLNEERKLLSRKFMKRKDVKSITELDSAIKEIRKTGNK